MRDIIRPLDGLHLDLRITKGAFRTGYHVCGHYERLFASAADPITALYGFCMGLTHVRTDRVTLMQDEAVVIRGRVRIESLTRVFQKTSRRLPLAVVRKADALAEWAIEGRHDIRVERIPYDGAHVLFAHDMRMTPSTNPWLGDSMLV